MVWLPVAEDPLGPALFPLQRPLYRHLHFVDLCRARASASIDGGGPGIDKGAYASVVGPRLDVSVLSAASNASTFASPELFSVVSAEAIAES